METKDEATSRDVLHFEKTLLTDEDDKTTRTETLSWPPRQRRPLQDVSAPYNISIDVSPWGKRNQKLISVHVSPSRKNKDDDERTKGDVCMISVTQTPTRRCLPLNEEEKGNGESKENCDRNSACRQRFGFNSTPIGSVPRRRILLRTPTNETKGNICVDDTPTKDFGNVKCSGSKSSETLSSSSSGSSKSANLYKTPVRSRGNPFDVGLADRLHLPFCSPTVFSQIIATAQEEETNFQWSIEDIAVLYPTSIEEESPGSQVEVVDPETESKAQKAIERFFSGVVVPSPWSRESKEAVEAEQVKPGLTNRSLFAKCSRMDAWTQTYLSFPQNLPPEVEAALEPYMSMIGPQSASCVVEDDDVSLSSSSLRRKLFFYNNDQLSPVRSNSTSVMQCEEEARSQQVSFFKSFQSTPVKTNRASLGTPGSAQFSSSPIGDGKKRSSMPSPLCSESPPISPIRDDKSPLKDEDCIEIRTRRRSEDGNKDVLELENSILECPKRFSRTNSRFKIVRENSNNAMQWNSSFVSMETDTLPPCQIPASRPSENTTQDCCDEAVSQDTGYQTGSLQTTNQLSQDTTSVDYVSQDNVDAFHPSNKPWVERDKTKFEFKSIMPVGTKMFLLDES